ncbi:MAG: malate synthase A [Planctomycetes bacterium]|nr:malate synthase A [Planctomycetota bacterium]
MLVHRSGGSALLAALPSTPPAVTVLGHAVAGAGHVLTGEALAFLLKLERSFRAPRAELLARRDAVQRELDLGWRPDFDASTSAVRDGGWRVAPAPNDLRDRRVELVVPVDRRSIVQGLASRANALVADFEHALAPTWQNVIDGHVNLRDAVRRDLRHVAPDTGRVHELPLGALPTLLVRPRGWRQVEPRVLVDGEPVSASLFDFALFAFHNARELVASGSAPYFDLPDLEHHGEARLWNDLFVAAQRELGLPLGTFRATARIESALAAFEMDELLHELRDHSAGLALGRAGHMASFARAFGANRASVLPDRDARDETGCFQRALGELLVRTCHRRGAHALGDATARVPNAPDAARHRGTLDRVGADVRREVRDGFDGTRVAHPSLVGVARMELDPVLAGPNQLARPSPETALAARDLFAVPAGRITEAGFATELECALAQLEAWLAGCGPTVVRGRRIDAAAGDAARATLRAWIRHRAQLEDGRVVDTELVLAQLARELAAARSWLGSTRFESSRFTLAADLLGRWLVAREGPATVAVAALAHLEGAARRA